jgi:hypothetical protein
MDVAIPKPLPQISLRSPINMPLLPELAPG